MVCCSRTFFTGTTRKAVSYSLFDRIFLNFCKWQTTFTSETEWDGKKKFGIIEQKFAFSSSAEISFLTPWFPGFTWTNEVRSFSACCNKKRETFCTCKLALVRQDQNQSIRSVFTCGGGTEAFDLRPTKIQAKQKRSSSYLT